MNNIWNNHRSRILVGAPILFALLLNTGNFGLSENAISLIPEGTIAIEEGELFPVLVRVNSHIPINATGALISFPTKNLEVATVDISQSLIGLWSEQPLFLNSGTTGSLSLSGGILGSDGWTGEGHVLRVIMRATGTGKAKISIEKGLLLAADGKGTNVLSERNNLVVYIRQSGTPSPDINQDNKVSLADTNLVYLGTFRDYDQKLDFNGDKIVSWGDVLTHFYLQAD